MEISVVSIGLLAQADAKIYVRLGRKITNLRVQTL